MLFLFAALLLLATTGLGAKAQDAEFAAAVQQMRALAQAGRDKEAEAVAERLIARTRAKEGDDSLDMAVAVEWLSGGLRESAAATQEQLAMLQQALAIRKKHVAPEDPSLASSYNNMAFALMKLERVKEALSLLQLALSLNEKTYGPEHLETATVALDQSSRRADQRQFGP